MSQPMPRVNLHGAVDLSSLAGPPAGQQQAAAPGGAPAGPVPGAVVTDVSEATFGQTVQLSTQVPVLLLLGSARSGATAELDAVLEKLAREYAGRFQLARVDGDANPQIAAALQVQAVPDGGRARGRPAAAAVPGRLPRGPGAPGARRGAARGRPERRHGRARGHRATTSPRPRPSRRCRRCTPRRWPPSSAATSTRPRRPTPRRSTRTRATPTPRPRCCRSS